MMKKWKTEIPKTHINIYIYDNFLLINAYVHAPKD